MDVEQFLLQNTNSRKNNCFGTKLASRLNSKPELVWNTVWIIWSFVLIWRQLSILALWPLFRLCKYSVSECILRIVFKRDSTSWIPFRMLLSKSLKSDNLHHIKEPNLSGKAFHTNFLVLAQLNNQNLCICSVIFKTTHLMSEQMIATSWKNVWMVGSEIISRNSACCVLLALNSQSKFNGTTFTKFSASTVLKIISKNKSDKQLTLA